LHDEMNNKSIKAFLGIAIAGVAVLTIASGPLVDRLGYAGMEKVRQFANTVGMFAAVPKNENNTLAQDLQQKQQELTEREMLIKQKEQTLGYKEESNNKTAVVYITVIGGLLLLLILMNFYLDWKRNRRQTD